MSLDAFKSIQFNAGEHIVIADFNNLQKQLRMAMMEMFILPRIGNTQDPSGGVANVDPEHNLYTLGETPSLVPLDICFAPFPGSAVIAGNGVANQVSFFSSGPLVQVIRAIDNDDALDPDSPAILSYWCKANEVTLTTAVGDAALPRYDIVEMKLEMETGSNETKVTTSLPINAFIDLNPLTTNVDSYVESQVSGEGGNNLTIRLIDDGTGVGSLTQSGFAFTFHFEDGVTTVQDFEDAIAADASQYLFIGSAGTPGNILTTAGDVLATTHLAGGVDQIISSSSIPKAYRVKATFQIKAGTAAATPEIPTPTAGFVAVAAVKVDALFSGAHTDNFRDLRWPLGGVRVYDVMYNQLNPGTLWTADHVGWRVNSSATALQVTSGDAECFAPCPGTGLARIMSIGVAGELVGTPEVELVQVTLDSSDPPTVTKLCDLVSASIVGADGFVFTNVVQLMDNVGLLHDGAREGTDHTGTGVWCDGSFNGPSERIGAVAVTLGNVKKAAVRINAEAGSYVSLVRFVIAHGMG